MKAIKLIIGIFFLVCSCQRDDFESSIQVDDPVNQQQDDVSFQQNFGNEITADFIGRILDRNGNDLSGVQVTIGLSTTTTDHNGIFVLNDASVFEKFAYIKATKEGYLNGSRSLIPVANGTNDVHLTLLEKTIVGTVNSGQQSEVTLAGSKVSFSGDFIDLQGNPYTGQVDVSMHYLAPNLRETFEQMPGMLFAQATNNDAVSLETYGMLAVNLYSPSGEILNIAQDAPAILEFPVDNLQTGIAPNEIPLWYFDEITGYWKAQGVATKVGDKYIGEVTHFTWWNCDVSNDFVAVCINFQFEDQLNTVHPSQGYYASIVRLNNGQVIFEGDFSETNACGIFPKNEEVLIKVYERCSFQLIHEEIIAPISDSNSTITITINDISNYNHVSITGIAINCSDEPLDDGYALLYSGDYISTDSNLIYIPINQGVLNYSSYFCDVSSYNMIIYDLENNSASDIIALDLSNEELNLASVSVCENQVGSIFNGDVFVESQSDVNLFGMLGYTEVTGFIGFVAAPSSNSITDLSPFNGLTRIGGLALTYNIGLQNLNGFENLVFVGDSSSSPSQIIISGCQSLQNIDALFNLAEVRGPIHISDNQSLLNIEGLSNLNKVDGSVDIYFNTYLQHLNGLENLNTAQDFDISFNNFLSDFCALQNLFSNGTYGAVSIQNNAYNPTAQDIVAGDCSN
jgi:hypothetical protein